MMEQDKGAEPNVVCPKCDTGLYLDIAAAVGKDQKFSYRVYPEAHSMMQAKAIGGQLVAMDDLMRACAKRDGGKVRTYIERTETHEDGSLEFHLVVLPVVEWDAKAGRFVEKPAQGTPTRRAETETGSVAEGDGGPAPKGCAQTPTQSGDQ